MATHSSFEGISTPASVIIGSVVIGASIIYASYHMAGPQTAAVQPVQQAQQQQQAQAPQPIAVDVSKVKTSGNPIVGSASAPVEIAYWYDYQCPFCRQNEENSMKQIMADYVGTGKLRIVFKDLQFLGNDSITLGLAGRAVWEVAPQKFYEWHKAIFDNQGQENSGWATKDKIRSITAGVLGATLADKVMGLMTTKAQAYQAAMDADKKEGAAMGINSTPSMVVGKTLISGAQPYASFKAAIDAALKNN